MKLAVWKLLAAADPQNEAYRYIRQDSDQYDPRSNVHLPDWIPIIHSPTCHWLTALTIGTGVFYHRRDLISISDLKNLVALDICNTDTTDHGSVDDGVVRAWSRHAKEADAFPELRVLIVRNEYSVTSQSLQYLSDFPSLALFGVQGCKVSSRDEVTATQHGWTVRDEHHMLRQLVRAIELSTSWDGPLRACVRRTEKLARPHAPGISNSTEQAPATTPHVDSPLLHMRLGQTSGDVVFGRPIIFFRALQDPSLTTQAMTQPTIPQSGHNPLKRHRSAPKLRARRRVDLGDVFDVQGLEHSVGTLRLPRNSSPVTPTPTPQCPVSPVPPTSHTSSHHPRAHTHSHLDKHTTPSHPLKQADPTLPLLQPPPQTHSKPHPSTALSTPTHRPQTTSTVSSPRIHSVPAKKIKRETSARSVCDPGGPSCRRRERTSTGEREREGVSDGDGAGDGNDEWLFDRKQAVEDGIGDVTL